MKTDNNALPWFPLTPEYIDNYHASVLKYLREESDSPSEDDPSYNTTVELLRQRSAEIFSRFSAQSLLDTLSVDRENLDTAVKVVASEVLILHKDNS